MYSRSCTATAQHICIWGDFFFSYQAKCEAVNQQVQQSCFHGVQKQGSDSVLNLHIVQRVLSTRQEGQDDETGSAPKYSELCFSSTRRGDECLNHNTQEG